MTALFNFLQRNQISRANPLPIVHTTEAYFLKKIVSTGEIEARPCNVFTGEKINYFFVGRAAYKRELYQEAPFWELPSCIVFEYDAKEAKRIFPFDTGAFHTKRYPNFINMMDINEFDVSSDVDAPQKLIGTFFNNARNYYRLNARPESQFKAQFEIDVLDEEVQALHRLIETKNENFDDRRFAIELQFDKAISLNSRKPLCVILPETYLSNEDYVKRIEKLGVKIISYPLYPLRKEYFYMSIYEKLDHFYAEKGFYAL
jgi:hypothetical protein